MIRQPDASPNQLLFRYAVWRIFCALFLYDFRVMSET